MDALGEVFGVIFNPGKLALPAFLPATRRNAEYMEQMTNVKVQMNSKVQMTKMISSI
jgi:hypothetical protein